MHVYLQLVLFLLYYIFLKEKNRGKEEGKNKEEDLFLSEKVTVSVGGACWESPLVVIDSPPSSNKHTVTPTNVDF